MSNRRDFEIGDSVIVTGATDGWRGLSNNRKIYGQVGQDINDFPFYGEEGVDEITGTIEALNPATARIQVDGANIYRYMGYDGSFSPQVGLRTIKMKYEFIRHSDAPPVDKLSVPEGMLDPRDPRLEWFWDKVSEHANLKNFCSQYDEILATFDLPKRKREYTVNISLKGVALTGKIMARSQREANELAKALES